MSFRSPYVLPMTVCEAPGATENWRRIHAPSSVIVATCLPSRSNVYAVRLTVKRTNARRIAGSREWLDEEALATHRLLVNDAVLLGVLHPALAVVAMNRRRLVAARDCREHARRESPREGAVP
jgi:hypothetical protein